MANEILVVCIAEPERSRYVPLEFIGSYMLGRPFTRYIPLVNGENVGWGNSASADLIQEHFENIFYGNA